MPEWANARFPNWPQAPTSGTVQRCPVCEGRGSVQAGFYAGDAWPGREKCRQCNGYGLFYFTLFGTVGSLPGAIPVFQEEP